MITEMNFKLLGNTLKVLKHVKIKVQFLFFLLIFKNFIFLYVNQQFWFETKVSYNISQRVTTVTVFPKGLWHETNKQNNFNKKNNIKRKKRLTSHTRILKQHTHTQYNSN